MPALVYLLSGLLQTGVGALEGGYPNFIAKEAGNTISQL